MRLMKEHLLKHLERAGQVLSYPKTTPGHEDEEITGRFDRFRLDAV